VLKVRGGTGRGKEREKRGGKRSGDQEKGVRATPIQNKKTFIMGRDSDYAILRGSGGENRGGKKRSRKGCHRREREKNRGERSG